MLVHVHVTPCIFPKHKIFSLIYSTGIKKTYILLKTEI